MTEDFQQALLQVARGMDALARVFEHRIAELRALGESDEQVREAVNGLQAVKDSGAIYLTWANHYAKRVSGEESELSDEIPDDEALDA